MIFGQYARRTPGLSAPRMFFFWSIPAVLCLTYMRLFYRLRREHMERVPREGPLLLVANHQSHYDPVIVGLAAADRPSGYLARASLFKFRPFAALIRLLNAIPLKPTQGSTEAMRAAADVMQAGRAVAVFPEGTRSRSGRTGAFKPGMLLLLRRARPTIVPMAIEGAHDIWPIGRTLPRLRGRLAVRVGHPIPPDEALAEDPAVLLARLRDDIERMRLELRDELRERTGGRFPPPGPGDADGSVTPAPDSAPSADGSPPPQAG